LALVPFAVIPAQAGMTFRFLEKFGRAGLKPARAKSNTGAGMADARSWLPNPTVGAALCGRPRASAEDEPWV